MFNEEQKRSFIKETAKSASTAKHLEVPFNQSEEMEKLFDSDICTWSNDQIIAFLKSRKHTNVQSLRDEHLALCRYIRWCASHNIPGISCNPESIPLNALIDVSAYAEKLIKDEESLSVYLSKIEDKRIGSIQTEVFHVYYWLAFCGIPQDYIADITKNDVNIKNMTITTHGHDFEINKHLADAIVKVFRWVKPDESILYPDEARYRKGEFARYIKNRIPKGTTALTYDNVYKSGLFIRTYQNENAGFIATFDEEVENRVSLNEYSGYGSGAQKQDAIRSRKKKLQKTLLADYEMWKLAFGLD